MLSVCYICATYTENRKNIKYIIKYEKSITIGGSIANRLFELGKC